MQLHAVLATASLHFALGEHFSLGLYSLLAPSLLPPFELCQGALPAPASVGFLVSYAFVL